MTTQELIDQLANLIIFGAMIGCILAYIVVKAVATIGGLLVDAVVWSADRIHARRAASAARAEP